MNNTIFKGYINAILIFLSYYSLTFFIPLIFFYFTIDYFLSINSNSLKLIIETIDIIIALIILLVIFWINKKNKLNWRSQSYNKKYSLLILFIIFPILFRVSVDPFFRFDEIFNLSELPSSEQLKNVEINYFKSSLTFLSVVILTPIVEECIFRGYILKALSNNKIQIKIVFSSFLFTLIHIPSSINSLIIIFIIGILLSFITLKIGLIFSIVFHIVYNFIWYIMEIYTHEYWNFIKLLNFNSLYWSIILVSIIIFYFLFKNIQKLT